MTAPVPCGRCGKPGHFVDLEYRGRFDSTLAARDARIQQTSDELSQVWPVFEAMIAAGVDRGIANDAMTYLLGRMHPDDARGPLS